MKNTLRESMPFHEKRVYVSNMLWQPLTNKQTGKQTRFVQINLVAFFEIIYLNMKILIKY